MNYIENIFLCLALPYVCLLYTSNTGLAMKLLGADVTLMCKLGKDAFGQMVMNLLEDYHVNCSVICSENEATSYSVILAVPGIDRIFLHNPGANNTFMAKDISREVLEETALFHFGYPSLMRNMYRNDGEELLNVMKCAKEAGCATSLDMASVDPNSDAGIVDWDLQMPCQGMLHSRLPLHISSHLTVCLLYTSM